MEQKAQSQSSATMPVAWQQNKDLGACMIELYDKSLWTDVKFHCKDHKDSARIHAHKVVLAARSPVFQAMFYGPCAGGKDEVVLDNADSKILDLLLRYMYSDDVELNEETASSVLEMAHYYQVTNLEQFCADYLATILTTENACEILTLAMLYQVTPLREACCSFIDKNASDVLNSDGFLELSEECLRYIVKGDTFFAQEDEIFIKAEEWAARKLSEDDLEKNGPNIKAALGETFYHLRLPTMAFQTLIKCTRRKGYLSADEYEDIIEFINKFPGSSVKSNSCVVRLPTEETIILNEENGETVTTDMVSTSFQISVTRDLKLSSIVLAEIQQYLIYDKEHYKEANFANTYINDTDINNFILAYRGKTLKLNSSGSRYASTLEEVHGENLLDEFDVVMYGCLTITCHNGGVCTEKNERGNTDGDHADNLDNFDDDAAVAAAAADDDDNDGGGDDGDDEDGDNVLDDDRNLIFQQTFELPSSRVSQGTYLLKEPVTLTKAESPYTVELILHYSCESNVKMMTVCSDITDTVTSEYEQLQVENITGQFSGIKSLGFENISNRDTV